MSHLENIQFTDGLMERGVQTFFRALIRKEEFGGHFKKKNLTKDTLKPKTPEEIP